MTHLYDVKKDIGEEDDSSAKFPEVTRELIVKFITWEKEMGVEQFSGLRPVGFGKPESEDLRLRQATRGETASAANGTFAYL